MRLLNLTHQPGLGVSVARWETWGQECEQVSGDGFSCTPGGQVGQSTNLCAFVTPSWGPRGFPLAVCSSVLFPRVANKTRVPTMVGPSPGPCV